MTNPTSPGPALSAGPLEPVRIAAATAGDEAILWLMLTYAASMGNAGPEQVENARADAHLSTYVKNWGRGRGDMGVIAWEAGGRAIGAAWLRLGHDPSGLRLADPSVPELATAVLPEARGRGVGTRMLQALIRAASPRYGAITLSVRAGNPARRLYARLGFAEVSRITNRVGGESIVMLRALPQGRTP